MKKISLACLSALFLLLVYTGCNTETNVSDFIGDWQRNDSIHVIFKTDKTYSVSVSGFQVNQGSYNFKKNLFNLTSSTSGCYDTLPAVYSYMNTTYSANGTFYRRMTLTLVSDTCTLRNGIVAGTYAIPNL